MQLLARFVGSCHRDDLDRVGPRVVEVPDQRRKQFAETAFASKRDQLVEVGDLAQRERVLYPPVVIVLRALLTSRRLGRLFFDAVLLHKYRI